MVLLSLAIAVSPCQLSAQVCHADVHAAARSLGWAISEGNPLEVDADLNADATLEHIVGVAANLMADDTESAVLIMVFRCATLAATTVVRDMRDPSGNLFGAELTLEVLRLDTSAALPLLRVEVQRSGGGSEAAARRRIFSLLHFSDAALTTAFSCVTHDDQTETDGSRRPPLDIMSGWVLRRTVLVRTAEIRVRRRLRTLRAGNRSTTTTGPWIRFARAGLVFLANGSPTCPDDGPQR